MFFASARASYVSTSTNLLDTVGERDKIAAAW
jgi:hypothetical protein